MSSSSCKRAPLRRLPWAAFAFLACALMSVEAFAAGSAAVQPQAALALQQNSASGTSKIPAELKDAVITEHLGDTIAIDEISLKDETGKDVRLADFFRKGRPVLLNLVYFECPGLCNFVLNGVVKSIKQLEWNVGTQFEMVTVSINHRESSELAAKKKASYLSMYSRPRAELGWHFLTGTEDQIKKLAAQVGFGFRWDEKEKQYAHSAATFALSSEGRISRYLYGIEYPAKDVRLALTEAGNGKIGSVIDRILLFCYHYDPAARKYSFYVTKVMQGACGATVLAFGGYLSVFWLRQRRRGSVLHV